MSENDWGLHRGWWEPPGDKRRTLSALTDAEREERFPTLFPATKLAAAPENPLVAQVKRWRNDLEDALFEIEEGNVRGVEDAVRILETMTHSMDQAIR